jgi:hypothetical protein
MPRVISLVLLCILMAWTGQLYYIFCIFVLSVLFYKIQNNKPDSRQSHVSASWETRLW